MLRRLGYLFALSVGLVACSSTRDPGAPVGRLVVGVQATAFSGFASAVFVDVRVDGVVVFDATMRLDPTAAAPFQEEIPVSGRVGAPVVVAAKVFGPDGALILERIASSRVVANTGKLLRVALETACVEFNSPISTLPLPVSCTQPLTCIGGSCAPSEVAEDALEEYVPTWLTSAPDICRPANHGPPEVVLGAGMTDYVTLVDEQVLPLERGPQGGHHIWLAARMRNLSRSGATTLLTARIDGDPEPVAPSSVVFTYDADEGGYCKLPGLRYQLDAASNDFANGYKRFLGKRLFVTLEVEDPAGGKASSTRTIRIADKLLCPDGTAACNDP